MWIAKLSNLYSHKRISLKSVAWPIYELGYACGIYLSLFLTIERYIAIARIRTLMTLKEAKKFTMIIVFCTCVFWIWPVCAKFTWATQSFGESGNYTVSVTTQFWKDNPGMDLYLFCQRAILQFFIPLICLAVFNTLIVLKVLCLQTPVNVIFLSVFLFLSLCVFKLNKVWLEPT